MPLLVFVDVNVFSIDHVVVSCSARRSTGGRSLISAGFRSWRRRLLIESLSQLVRRSLQLVESVVKFFNSTFGQCLLRLCNRSFNVACNCSNLLTVFVQRLLHLIDKSVQTIARFDLFALASIVS